ncbi:MAG: hypothetical protein CMM07_07375 [Rhodopirellula sp.]|nr:hypothetical protein [Rhodopirellula sp.]
MRHRGAIFNAHWLRRFDEFGVCDDPRSQFLVGTWDSGNQITQGHFSAALFLGNTLELAFRVDFGALIRRAKP